MKLEAQLPYLHVYTPMYSAHTILQTLYLATIWQPQDPTSFSWHLYLL